LKMAGSKSLFACTKCHSRHPFDELSKEEHLCKACRKKYPLVPCVYCRLEYHILTKVNGEKVCSKCSHYLSLHGKPSNCKYCQIKAAFDKSCCARCSSSEKRYGAPVSCNRCKLRCAFNKSKESQIKVGGQILCLQCTLEYKRIRHKQQKQTEKIDKTQSWKSEPKLVALKAENLATKFKSGFDPSKTSHRSSRGNSPFLSMATSQDSSSKNDNHEFTYNDHMSEMTKLRDEIAVLKKKIMLKEKNMLDKDKKINELNAEQWERDKVFRTKLSSVQKEADEKILQLQTENLALKRQIGTLNKNQKAKKERKPNKIQLEHHKLSSPATSAIPSYIKNEIKSERDSKSKSDTDEKTDTEDKTDIDEKTDTEDKTDIDEKIDVDDKTDFDEKIDVNVEEKTDVNDQSDIELPDTQLNKKPSLNLTDFNIVVHKEDIPLKEENNTTEDETATEDENITEAKVDAVTDDEKNNNLDDENIDVEGEEENGKEKDIQRSFDEAQNDEIRKLMSADSANETKQKVSKKQSGKKRSSKKKKRKNSLAIVEDDGHSSSGGEVNNDEPLRKRKRKKRTKILDDDEDEDEVLTIDETTTQVNNETTLDSPVPPEIISRNLSSASPQQSPEAIDEVESNPVSPISADVCPGSPQLDISFNDEENNDEELFKPILDDSDISADEI